MIRNTSLEGMAAEGGGGGMFTLWVFAIDAALVETHTKIFNSRGGFLADVMFHHRETMKSNQHTVMKQRKDSHS